jgi:pimeloyl-ACP methyl ester carboxylesterase
VVAGGALWACSSPSLESGTTAGGLYYESSGDGEPVVLMHGFSLDRRMWDEQVALLAPDYRVIRYDLRGHGLSSEADRPFSHHEDLLDLFEALELDTAVLVGLSLGAEVAIDFALAYPQRVVGLMLAAPGLSGYTPRGSFEWMAPVMVPLQAGDPQGATRAWVQTPIMRIENDQAADSVMREIVLSNWAVWTGDPSLRMMLDPPAVGRLSELSAPTLVLVGEADLIDTRVVSDTLALCIRGAEKIMVPGVGHLINLAAPDTFIEVVRRFLRTSSDAASTTTRESPTC